MKIMLLFLSLGLYFSSCHFLLAQAIGRPVSPGRPSRPIYRPGYPGYNPGYGYGYPMYTEPVEGKLYTAQDYWAAKRKAFAEKGNTKDVGSAQEHGSEQVREERNERYENRIGVARDIMGTNNGGNSSSVSSVNTDSTAAGDSTQSTGKTDNSRKSSITISDSKPNKPPEGVIDSSKLVGDGSYGRANIAKILTDQLGVAYSSDGETPEDGFSPVGLIKYVARKLGVNPKANNAAEAWENAGLFIQVSYGEFQTGDLLFYKLFSKSAQKDELFMALALDSTSMVYPSFTRKKVIKRSYKEDFWKKHFIGAKRIPPQMR